jgi:plasmid stabilization system protein ParE
MAVRLVLAAEVEQDITEAFAWYEDQRSGLGEEFLASVEAALAAIRRDPELHATVHENYRRGFVRRFPYGIFYEYSARTVTVYCIIHAARDPAKWRKRISR